MKNLTAVVIDDEKPHHKFISRLINKHFPEITQINSFSNSNDALNYLNSRPVDILYLDIQMPFLNGFQLLEKLEINIPPTIFITAFDEYAIKAIRFCALDYLLKPVREEQFIQATNRAIQVLQEKNTNLAMQMLLANWQNKTLHKIALPSMERVDYVEVSKILRCEGQNNYTLVITTQGEKYLVSKTLKEYEELLSDHGFCRVHLSHLVNLRFVKSFIRKDGMHLILSNQEKIRVSRSRKDELLNKLKSI